MGSGASAAVVEVPGADLRLPTSGLKFSVNQLRALNSYIDSLYEEDQKGRMSIENESLVENVVQRIVDGAGQRDPRFRCCHLIALHRGKKMRSRSLEYLVTLDALPVLNADSQDCSLQEGPVGYGKVRLSDREAEKWEEFLTPAGYLCRDAVVARWVGLVARCAHARGGGGCRVLSPRAAAHAAPYRYCYLEKVSPLQSSTERLAIVEGAAWVLVRVGQVEAKLVLGARVAGCSASAHFFTMPLTHPLALLHYTSAQTDYYAVAIGPPATEVCSERAATWQLWHPALEAALDEHCSDLSTAARVAGALNMLVDKMREGYYQGSLRLVSRYMAGCTLRRRIERCAASVAGTARALPAAHASHHLLLTLDSLLGLCERGGRAGYVWGSARSGSARRGARASDWGCDAAALHACLLHLHRMPGEEIPASPAESLETILFNRWDNLNKELKVAAGTVAKYSRRQLVYLWRVATELVKCKNMVAVENHSTFRANLLQATSQDLEPVEDLIHILAIMLDQARDSYINNFHSRNDEYFDRELSAYRSKKWNKLKDYYDASSACLIDAVRRDPALRKEDLDDEPTFMRNVLNWLYKGAKEDKKYLGPVLKPYLDDIFNTSLENSWFLEDFDAKKCKKEFDGLSEYCQKVHEGSLDPCQGLLDAAKKLSWAKAMVDFLDRYKHYEFRLVFPTGSGLATVHRARLPARRERAARTLTLGRRDKADAKRRLATRCVIQAFSDVLLAHGHQIPKKLPRLESTDEILASVKTGNYWRNNTKPDIIPSTSIPDVTNSITESEPKAKRRPRKERPATAYGFPAISITNQSDKQTLRRKYHTLKSLVYTEQIENIKELKTRPRSAGSTMRIKEALSKPSLLETLDFINSVKDTLSVEESGASEVEEGAWSVEEEWLAGKVAPLNLISSRCGGTLHLTLGDLVTALLNRRRFTTLQELCEWLGGAREAALLALHRLARDSRARSSDRNNCSWQLPAVGDGRYRARAPDAASEDDALFVPQPPPRLSSKDHPITQRYSDFIPPHRLQELEHRLNQINLTDSSTQNKYFADTKLTPTKNIYTDAQTNLESKFLPDYKNSVSKNNYLKEKFLNNNQYQITIKPHVTQNKYHTDSKPIFTRNEYIDPKPTLTRNEYIDSNLILTRKEHMSDSRPISTQKYVSDLVRPNAPYTGIINPIYDIKMPKDMFSVKRSRSLGRSFSSKRVGFEVIKYNVTLGRRGGKRTNDVVTAITGTSAETGLDSNGNYFHRNVPTVVGDSYKISRITID